MIIFFPLLFFFNIIFLLENKGNPVSKVPDASYSPCPENVIIQFPCHWADFIVLGGISILPPLFLLKLLNVPYRSNYKTRLKSKKKKRKTVYEKPLWVWKLYQRWIKCFFSHPEFQFLTHLLLVPSQILKWCEIVGRLKDGDSSNKSWCIQSFDPSPATRNKKTALALGD